MQMLLRATGLLLSALVMELVATLSTAVVAVEKSHDSRPCAAWGLA